MGDAESGPLWLSFNSQLRVEFRGATATSDAGCCRPTSGMSASARARHCAPLDRSAVSASPRAGCGRRASKASARSLPVDSLRCHAFAS
jgi:hypothetical protein